MSRLDVEGLKRRISDAALGQGQVRLVYLFGSLAGGQVGPLSDADLAVLLAPGAPVARSRSQLASLFSAGLEGVAVDLVILNRAPVELAYAVIAQGEILFQRDPAERVEYEADVLSRYGDFLPFLRIQRQAILEGTGHERRVRRHREALGRTERALAAPGAAERETAD